MYKEQVPVKISDLLTELRQDLNLENEEDDLPEKTYLLFLTDYLIAAKIDNKSKISVKDDFLPQEFGKGYLQKKIIAKARVFALLGKAFKGCLLNSNVELKDFKDILKNLNETYKTVFVNLREYITKGERREFDRFCDGGVAVLEDLNSRNRAFTHRIDLLKETLQTIRAPEEQRQPEQQSLHNSNKQKAYRIFLFLLLGGGSVGAYYIIKNYHSLKNYLFSR